MHKEWKYSCGVAIRCGALVVSVGGVSVLCSAVSVNVLLFLLWPVLRLLLAWLLHPITRAAYGLPVVELATSLFYMLDTMIFELGHENSPSFHTFYP